MGSHLIKSWATTQTVIALSSGEAEYYSVTRGACEGLGIVGLLEDLGDQRIPIEVLTDSSAAKGIASRRGVGKVKHLDTRTLWVQDQVDRGRRKVRKIPGDTNPADLLTKFLAGPRTQQLLARIPVQFDEGRHYLAPALQDNGCEQAG